jgi:hypothetical protein
MLQTGKISDWILRRCQSKPKIQKVALVHIQEDGSIGSASLILENTLEAKLSGQELTQAVQDIATEFSTEAIDHAGTYQRPQRYGVVVHDAKGMPVGHHLFLVSPPISDVFSAQQTEPATVTGVLSQVMRLTDGHAHLMVMDRQEVMSRLLEENDRLRGTHEKLTNQISAMQDRHFQMIEHTETLLDRKAERELKLEEHKTEAARTEWLMQQAQMLLPHIVARFGNFKMAAGPTEPAKIAKAFETITPEQGAALFGTEEAPGLLTPEQTRAIFEALGFTKGA